MRRHRSEPDRGAIALAPASNAEYTPAGMRSSAKKPVPPDVGQDVEKRKLVKRLNRSRGQLDALQRAVVELDEPSARVLQQATACRGALDGFIAEVIEDHIREQVVDARDRSEASRAAEELIGIVHSYLT